MITDIEPEVEPFGLSSENVAANLNLNACETNDLLIRADGDTLTVAGDIDLYAAPRFRLRAEEHIASVEAPRFDMDGVAFLDSAGLATLLYLSRKAAASHKTLRIRIGGSPRRVLRITGIDRMLVVEN